MSSRDGGRMVPCFWGQYVGCCIYEISIMSLKTLFERQLYQEMVQLFDITSYHYWKTQPKSRCAIQQNYHKFVKKIWININQHRHVTKQGIIFSPKLGHDILNILHMLDIVKKIQPKRNCYI